MAERVQPIAPNKTCRHTTTDKQEKINLHTSITVFLFNVAFGQKHPYLIVTEISFLLYIFP